MCTSQGEFAKHLEPPQKKSELKRFEPLEQLEKEEIERLALQDEENASWDAEVEPSDTTPWLQYTKWPRQCASRPIEIIAATARQPCPYLSKDYALGFWKRFFCYIFRVWAMSEEARFEIYGLVFNEQQQMTISRIWQVLDETIVDCIGGEQADESDEESEGETASTQDRSGRLVSEVEHNVSQVTE